MKSILKKVAGVAITAVLALGMFGCSNDSDSHEHTFATSYSSDATHHWYAATCEHTTEVKDKAEHSFGEWKSNDDASTEADGTKTRICSDCLYEETITDEGSKIEIVATPAFSVASGDIERGTSVTVTCATEGAKIYYTTDDSAPTTASTEYTAAISVTEAVTIKAIAVKDGMNDSAIASASYTIKETVATPAFSVASGAVDSGTSVTISCTTEGAKIYYTTDGSAPTTASTEYTAAISVTAAVTLKAIAVKDGMNDSAAASASYLIIPTKATCVPGDFVLKDGTMLPKDITLSDAQRSNVAAVIVRAATEEKPALGVGIVHNRSGLVWCKRFTDTENRIEVSGYITKITALQGDKESGYMDGSNSWDLLVDACADLKNKTGEEFEKAAENYPAFNYCRLYGTKNNLSGDLANGWYLPTVAELYTIYQNKTAVDASLEKAGGSQFGTFSYWSCCQNPSSYDSAWRLYFGDGGMYDTTKDIRGIYVCSVRAFN